MSSLLVLLLMALAGLVIYCVMAYNRLVRLKHNVSAAWSNIDVLLKQRHDELPKLVTTCREYMKYEQETLEKVTLARSQVSSAMQSGDMAELGVAESFMSNTLGRLFALTESYPELKSNESFMRLQSRISSLENAIADRREYYNDSVNINNIVVDEFPTNLIARQFAFVKAELFIVNKDELADVNLEQLFAA
jgi:LemA protein